MDAVVKSFAISGVDGYIVEIEVDTLYGQPSINIVGLGDQAIREARERLQAAIIHDEYEFPKMKVVINLAPGDLKKTGSHFDLGMAIGLLLQTEQLKAESLENFGFIGELFLNAMLRPSTGVLPMAVAAKQAGIKNFIVPKENLEEAALVRDINVYGFEDLQQVVKFFKEGISKFVIPESMPLKNPSTGGISVDFNEIQGQENLIDYIVIAAAGGHHLLMIGSPGCGKSMVAKRISTILPSMGEQESLEVTKVHSVAGLLRDRGRLVHSRPFRASHHNASTNSLIGGGNYAMPGEISLAHHGILFLDEIAEFNKKTLDALRQPMEDGRVTISRVNCTNTYPCNFMLVAAMNPCPCGYYGHPKCRCTDYEILKYRQKVSGPILDRIDIQKYVQPVNFMSLSAPKRGRSSEELKERVEMSRKIQFNRYQGIAGVQCNSQMTPDMINEFCHLEQDSMRLLQRAYDRFQYSARTYHKFLKVARTFADMDGSVKIRRQDVASSLMSRDLEKEKQGLMVV